MGGLRWAFGDRRAWLLFAAGCPAGGLFYALIGPFGSGSQPFGLRLFYCMAICVVAAPVFFLGLRLGLLLGRRLAWPIWLSSLALAPVFGLIVAMETYWLAPLMWLGHPPPQPTFLRNYLQGLVIMAPSAVILGWWMMRPRGETPTAASGPAPPRLLARIPVSIRGQILALEAEDHYVRVHTARGSALILMRLADALDELDGLEGMRVHRSWWVAKGAIAQAQARGRRMSLTLSNGVVAPVTREAAPLIRRAGWV
jgi:hypothetical protein